MRTPRVLPEATRSLNDPILWPLVHVDATRETDPDFPDSARPDPEEVAAERLDECREMLLAVGWR